MLHSRTITLCLGRTCLGALRVYWYAKVCISTFGYSCSIASATRFTNRIMLPAGLPSFASTRAHSGQVQ